MTRNQLRTQILGWGQLRYELFEQVHHLGPEVFQTNNWRVQWIDQVKQLRNFNHLTWRKQNIDVMYVEVMFILNVSTSNFSEDVPPYPRHNLLAETA